MLNRLFNWFRRSPGAPSAPTAAEGRWTARRWEAAETNRLNSAHWAKALEQPLNVDLVDKLTTLRARTTFELARNPVLEGVVNTFAQDIAGEDGPMLRVRSGSRAYAQALQDLWWDWFNAPEMSGKLTGADMLQLWVRRLMDSGEFVAQRVSRRVDPGPIAFRLKLIHPRRLATPPEMAGNADVVLGVKRTAEGQPVEYYVADPQRFGAFELYLKYTPIAARDLIHEFVTTEEDQVRGVPWLATPLQTTADLRDFDAQVLDAARAAADQAVVWYTEHPESNYIEVNEVCDIERRMQQTGPPGWKPMQMRPEQPAINYVEYRADRLREVGRPFGMPLMMVRLGSEQHNFSSARFDNEVYKRGIRKVRRWLERRTLNSLVEEVRREAELYAAANPDWRYAALARPPAKFDFNFVWQPLIAVDAEKDAQDKQARMEAGTLPFDEACAEDGREAEAVIEKHAEVIAMFKAKDLPLPSWAQKWGDPQLRQQAEAMAASQLSGKTPQNNNGRSNGHVRN